MNLYSNMETDSQIQKVNEQLPVNRGKGESTDRGMELRDAKVYEKGNKNVLYSIENHSHYLVICFNGICKSTGSLLYT